MILISLFQFWDCGGKIKGLGDGYYIRTKIPHPLIHIYGHTHAYARTYSFFHGRTPRMHTQLLSFFLSLAYTEANAAIIMFSNISKLSYTAVTQYHRDVTRVCDDIPIVLGDQSHTHTSAH